MSTIWLSDCEIAASAPRQHGLLLRQLRVERFLHEDGKNVALLHPVALVDPQLEHAKSFDLRRDQDLIARNEGTGDGDHLGEVGQRRPDDRHGRRQRRLGLGCGVVQFCPAVAAPGGDELRRKVRHDEHAAAGNDADHHE